VSRSRRGSTFDTEEGTAVDGTSTRPELASSPNPAGLGRRLACLVYDALLLLAVLFLGSALFTSVAGAADTLFARVALQALLVTLAGAYFVWCWTHSGQTLPMQAWHLRIVDAGSGQPPGIRKALGRYLLAIPGTLVAGVSFLWGIVDRDRLFLHDRLAGTRIVKVNRRSKPTAARPARSSPPRSR
jgi:uncharacterized RDD family membrane protein YckC